MHIPVEDASYLQKNELCGHVEHKPIRTLGKSFLFCFLPGFLLLVLGVPMAVCGGTGLRWWTGDGISLIRIAAAVLLYLGLCCLCRLFPTYEDALYLCEAYEDSKNIAAKIILCIPVYVIRAGAFLARFSVSLLLAAALALCMILL